MDIKLNKQKKELMQYIEQLYDQLEIVTKSQPIPAQQILECLIKKNELKLAQLIHESHRKIG